MGKGSRTREAAQLRVAQMRAEEARRDKRHRMMVAWGSVAGVLVLVAALVGVKIATNGTQSTPASAAGLASPAIVSELSTVPSATTNAVGAGSVTTKPVAITAPALTSGGLPRILYDGAEYCPFCAGERWAVAVALSRFGTWSNLGVTTSSSTDIYPSTATLAFHGATYTSSYLTFTGYEETTNQPQGSSYVPLDTLPSADQAIVSKYDAVPYVSSSSAGSIPFVDIGGQFVISGASYDVSVLQGKTHEQIAAALKDPTSAISKAIIGTANVITADICKATGNVPASVCTAPGVVAAGA